MDAVEASLAVGTRRKSRKNTGGKFLRSRANIERERRALELLRDGATHQEIGDALGITKSSATTLIHRALAYRAENEGPTVEAARSLHIARLEHMLSRWFPRAVGDYLDPETGETSHPPDYRAADMSLKILSQIADVQGTKKTPMAVSQPTGQPSSGDVHVHFHQPEDRQRAEATILSGLAAMVAKTSAVEGQLAAIGTSTAALNGEIVNDTPGPPPVRT